MGTTILQDIYNDTKLLITTVTGFEDGEEGFRICERFALSNFKHHRFLSINSHSVKNYIDEMVKKFSIHGKYEVAKKFQDLVNSFLTSFDFEHHPQSDLQWALLSLVINLANETSKADLASLKLSTNEHSFDATVTIEEDESTTFDWGQYLKEGQEDFVCNYKSETESEWSDDETIQFSEVAKSVSIPPKKNVVSCVPTKVVQAEIDETSKVLVKQAEYRKWLLKNVQNTWWNELEYRHYPTNSPFPDAKFCYLWNNIVSKGLHFISTLSEYHIIRELLWMFHVQKPMVVFQEKNEADFFIRPNLSISSLSAVTFNSILLPFCEYFIMLHKMEQFGENLYIDHNLQQIHRSAPLTYEAYNAALSEHLFKLKSVVIDLEKSVMIQDDCNTMLSLSKDLKKHLKHIKMLYEIHRSVITDFQNSANWKCASNLLSGLYREMENSSSREKSNICASLYLRSIKVYLNIIDTWLSEGRLEDWRDEFVIARISESMKEDEGLYDSFVLRPLDPICLSDPIMQLLLYKVSHMGRSIELLVSLDRTSDMWSISAADVPRPPMSSEFLKEVLAEFTRYNADIVIDETDTSAPEIETCSKPKFDLDVDMHVTSQILKLNNPFLMKAYEKCLPCTLFNKDEVDTKPSGHTLITGQDDTVYKRLQSMSSSILPFRKVLESTLIKILDSRYQGVSKLVKNILIKEYKLEEQLKLMRCIYMMETGHIMHRFYQLVFSEIENSPIWNNSFYLTNILEEVLSHEWPDLSSRWSITVQNVRTHRVLNAVDKITLHYAAGWPMNMVLNKDALNKYNVIFRFQLKLKWALWTLNNLKFSDIEESKSTFISNKIQHFYTRRLENLRFWLLHAIGSIHAYLCGQVLQSLGFLFEKALKQCENLDDIITVHNEYLEKVHEHCLQTTDFEDLMATINNLLAMCIHVRDKWKRGSAALTAKDLDILEANYTNYHTYLALALHNAVQHKDADYYKLTPQIQVITDEDNSADDSLEIIDDHITDLSRNMLTEVAHQSLPPSGIPVPFPKCNIYWNATSLNSEIRLPELSVLSPYEKTFSYLRWYYCDERTAAKHMSACILYEELGNLIKSIEHDQFSDDTSSGDALYAAAMISINTVYNSLPRQDNEMIMDWHDKETSEAEGDCLEQFISTDNEEKSEGERSVNSSPRKSVTKVNRQVTSDFRKLTKNNINEIEALKRYDDAAQENRVIHKAVKEKGVKPQEILKYNQVNDMTTTNQLSDLIASSTSESPSKSNVKLSVSQIWNMIVTKGRPVSNYVPTESENSIPSTGSIIDHSMECENIVHELGADISTCKGELDLNVLYRRSDTDITKSTECESIKDDTEIVANNYLLNSEIQNTYCKNTHIYRNSPVYQRATQSESRKTLNESVQHLSMEPDSLNASEISVKSVRNNDKNSPSLQSANNKSGNNTDSSKQLFTDFIEYTEPLGDNQVDKKVDGVKGFFKKSSKVSDSFNRKKGRRTQEPNYASFSGQIEEQRKTCILS